MHVEDDTLNLLPLRHNMNDYPRLDIKCADDYGAVLTDYCCLSATGIP